MLYSRLLQLGISLASLPKRSKRFDASLPPGDPSVVTGGIDGCVFARTKNRPQRQAGSASQICKTHAGNAARASNYALKVLDTYLRGAAAAMMHP